MRRWLAVMSALVVVGLTMAPIARASAHPEDPPDIARPCTVDIDMEDNGTPIVGAPITLYQVADMQPSGTYFELTATFAASGADLTDIATADDNTATAADLLAFATASQLAGQSAVTASDGEASFAALPAGLYLIAPGLAKGYLPMTPYLLMLPQVGDDDAWMYNVTAQPKTQPILASAPPSSSAPTSSSPPAPSSAPPSSSTTSTSTPSDGSSATTGGSILATRGSAAVFTAIALVLAGLGLAMARVGKRRQGAHE